MPSKPPKRVKMSLDDNVPLETANEPQAFHYDVVIVEDPCGTEDRRIADTGEIVVKTEEPDLLQGVEPETRTMTAELKVEQASEDSDESSDDSIDDQPSRRHTKGRFAESDKVDVQPVLTRSGSVLVHHINGPGEEFISLKPAIPWNVGNLGCSAQIVQDEFKIVLHHLGCLLLVDDSFVARVEIMDVGQLSRNRSFRQAKVMLLRQLRIVQILLDGVTNERNLCRAGLLGFINEIRNQTATNRESAVDAAQIIGLVQKSTDLNFIKLCQLLHENPLVSECLKEHADNLLQIELATEKRNRLFPNNQFLDDPHELVLALRQFCDAVAESHAKLLLDATPQYVQDLLAGVSHLNLFRINVKDVKVFTDLDQVLNKEIFQKPLIDLAKRWCDYVKMLSPSDPIVTVVNPIYFSLCRCLEEVIVEIAGKTDHNPKELLWSDDHGWHAMISAFRWKTETSLAKCIEREYLFVFRLLKHFDPASGNAKPFDYSTHRLLGGKDTESMLGRGTQPNSLGIADEFYVWYCQLDDVLHYALPERINCLHIFEQILKNYAELLRKATVEQIEMVRVITQSTGRFIVQTSPFVNSDKAQSGEDKQILQLQLDVINRTMLEAEAAKFFRDLIDVFSGYWKNRCGIIENIPSKNGLAEMTQVKKSLLAIVAIALRKNVGAEHVINLFRSLNDLIVDLDDVSFDWYVKSLPEGPMQAAVALKFIEPVDNKWSGTDNQTYFVVESQKFQQMFAVLLNGTTCPKHCVLDVVIKLLDCIRFQLDRERWTSNKCLSEADQMISSSVLISSIRSSLIYLREQVEYVSFDLFQEERIKPFWNVAENSRSLEDFSKRAGLIKESFSYTRKQNEMSVTEALRMYGELNDEGDYNAKRLQQAYQRYSDQFVRYMAETVPDGKDGGKADAVSKLVRESVQPILFKEWTAEFKSMELPKVLAGVAAVWSILVSADVSSTGKLFKPHCIQILCVLRLLGADGEEKGVSKHLAQVLTGQGKSLILALVASVLALTGHQVQMVCYNEYLVKRDAKDFDNLLNVLKLKGSIRYGTFEEMAEAVISPVIGGKTMELREFVIDRILSGPRTLRLKKPEAQVQANSVLLMDEVDIFFTREFYGSQYNPVKQLFVPGLDAIQIEIWSKVNSAGNHDVHTVTAHINEYILSSQFDRKAQFEKFLNKSTSYELLVDMNKCTRQTFNNKSLFANCLGTMIENALHIATSPSRFQDYQINQKGVIARRVNEKLVTDSINKYYSIFNYFRLKKKHFIPYTNDECNYGYLNIDCGSLSYAMLPKAYPLILGVTGTLTSLNQHEKAAIDRLYNINRSSIMPSFFGCSNLHFNPEEHFTHLATKSLWMGQIFNKAHEVIKANRAVIIFFYDKTLLKKFRTEYCSQFERLHVLTEKTNKDKHERLLGEAGVAKTVTLATRGMGRGVDYKSSVTVENNGGVHVIQTFFSLDVKEETQIRGRTARKDNKGSYELIVLKSHLKENKLIGANYGGSYAELDAARVRISSTENEDIARSIKSKEQDHHTTMDYLQSFFS